MRARHAVAGPFALINGHQWEIFRLICVDKMKPNIPRGILNFRMAKPLAIRRNIALAQLFSCQSVAICDNAREARFRGDATASWQSQQVLCAWWDMYKMTGEV
jgi:hypothetical protein